MAENNEEKLILSYNSFRARPRFARPREGTLAETRSLEIECNGNPSEWERNSRVSVHIGVFDNYYQSMRDIRDKDACVCKCSLVNGTRRPRDHEVSVYFRRFPDVNRRYLSLSCSLSISLSLSRAFEYFRNRNRLLFHTEQRNFFFY